MNELMLQYLNISCLLKHCEGAKMNILIADFETVVYHK